VTKVTREQVLGLGS